MEWQAAIDTYRSLRAGIAAIGLVLGFGLGLLVLTTGGGIPPSISATFYGPMQGVFVACLVAVGLALFAVKGRPGAENTLLDVAGVLIPVVAFVPTPTIDPTCPVPGAECVPERFHASVTIGFGAYLATAAVALVFVGVRLLRAGAAAQSDTRRGFLVLLVVWIAAFLFRQFGDGLFLQFAHYATAIPFFVILVIVVFINALRSPDEPGVRREVEDGYRKLYSVTATGMALGVVVGVVTFLRTGRQNAQATTDSVRVPVIFWVEAWLLLLFVVYWVIQTVELWYRTAPREPDGQTVAPI
nr:hypothetical protein [Propionicimonas sp.]